MKLYEKSLFEAFVWTQAVENVVHDLVLDCADDGRLQLNEKDFLGCKKLRLSLGQLIGKLEPCIAGDLYGKLKELNRLRNEVVHRSNYVVNILVWSWDPESGGEVDEEIRRFQQVKTYAGEVYGALLDEENEGLATNNAQIRCDLPK